ncbi:MAG TPA: hypothetical protein VF041_09620 [Gemmatimonadaceae bacterium]
MRTERRGARDFRARRGRARATARSAPALAALLVAWAVSSCRGTIASRAELAEYRRLRGALVSAETVATGTHGRYARYRVRLSSSTGLVATGWLLSPGAGSRCARAPAVLLQDGREENADVIGRLPSEFGDVVVLSLDYPDAIPYEIRLGDVMRRAARLRHAAREIPARFSLGAAYLARRRDVDHARIAIAATSFAVPFATIAAAIDSRFHDAAFIYGAGDLPSVLAANLDTRPRVARKPLAWLATRPFAELAPERFIGRIAPRAVVMVNGADDPQMPAAAVRRLYRAARAPKTLIWLRTGHLEPTDSSLIRALVDTAFARLPVLHAGVHDATCAVVAKP